MTSVTHAVESSTAAESGPGTLHGVGGMMPGWVGDDDAGCAASWDWTAPWG